MMVKNKVQFQEGYSLFELFENYGTDEQCRNALFKWKFSDGFVCSECGSKKYYTLKTVIYTSATTIIIKSLLQVEHTKLPISRL